jgi:predicted MFS family arabinose efflux permease
MADISTSVNHKNMIVSFRNLRTDEDHMAESRAETPALVLLGILSMGTNVMVPILVDALIEQLGMSRIEAGRITSFEFFGALAGSILVLSLVHKVGRRTLAYCGIPVWTACNIVSAIHPTHDALPFLRAGSGFGMGISLAITMGAIAGRPNPVRLFAGLMVGVPLYLMMAIPALQMAVGKAGVPGAYGFLGVMAATGLLLASQLPNRPPRAEGDGGHGKALLPSPMAATVVLASLVFFTGFSGSWAYVSQVGRSIGIAPQIVAWIIGTAQLASIVGSFLAGILNERFGHALPLIFAMALAIGGAVLLADAGTQAMFSASLVPLLFGWLMSQPFVIGVSARLDATGTVATAVNVAQNMGTAAGPYLAARVIDGQSASLVGYFAAILFGTGLLLMLPSALRAPAGRPSRRVGNPVDSIRRGG